MSAVRVAHEGAVARITIDRPEARNAFNEELIADLTTAFAEVGEALEVRVVVLAGEGKAFSAGADLAMMQRQGELSEAENVEDAQTLAALFRTIAECPRPVIARVHGAALGGGAGLVTAADIAIASEDAVIGFPEVRLGLLPATIAPHVLRKVSPGDARALFLRGRAIDARTALRVGLFTEVVPAEELDAAVEVVVQDVLAAAPGALAAAKALVRDVPRLAPGEVDREMALRIARARASDEGREGTRAFLGRRSPSWADGAAHD